MNKNVTLSSLFLSAIAFGLVGCNQAPNTDTTPSESDNVTTSESMVEESDIVVDSEETSDTGINETQYKNGTYEAVGNYTSPGGEEEVGVTVTIENGLIVDSTVEVLAERDASVKWQTAFSENHAEQVVGVSIYDVQIDKAGGSSLTPIGFMDALEKIKAEAEA